MLQNVSGRSTATFLLSSLTHSHTASIMSVMYSRLPARLQDGAAFTHRKSKKVRKQSETLLFVCNVD